MMPDKNLVEIRLADESDYEDILNVYRPYILETSISFETEVPTVDAFCKRMRSVQSDMPLLVCRIDGELAGYAYASHYHSRAAYAWDIETSIYVSEDYHRGGIGTALYDGMLQTLRQMNYINAYACITGSSIQSIRFHQKYGFTECAHFHDCGYKFGIWQDIIWMELNLAEHSFTDRPVSIDTLDPSDIRRILDPVQSRLESLIRDDIMKCDDFLGILFK